MKTKILACDYNAETGKSEITIACRYGVFSATAKATAEDMPYASRYLGPEIAEKKAVIKALKSHRKDLRIAFKEAWHTFDTFDQSIYDMPKCVYSRMIELKKKIDAVNNEIDAIEKAIDAGVENYISQKVKNK